MLQGSESDCAGAKVKLSENAKAAKAARAGRKREGWHRRVLVPKFAQSLQWTITKAHRSPGMFTWSEPLGTECLSPMLSLEPLKTRQCYLKPLYLQPFWLERFSFLFHLSLANWPARNLCGLWVTVQQKVSFWSTLVKVFEPKRNSPSSCSPMIPILPRFPGF